MPTTDRFSIRIINYLLISLLLASLASCGFQLRESVAIPENFGPVKITGISEFSTMYKAVRNALRQSSIEITHDNSTANHILVINRVRNERRVLSVDSSGKVAENELIKSIHFQLLDRDGNSVTEPQTISTNRSYAVPESAGLGTALEDQEISRSMEESLVERMLRYLAGRI